jgi:hypothetical protein
MPSGGDRHNGCLKRQTRMETSFWAQPTRYLRSLPTAAQARARVHLVPHPASPSNPSSKSSFLATAACEWDLRDLEKSSHLRYLRQQGRHLGSTPALDGSVPGQNSQSPIISFLAPSYQTWRRLRSHGLACTRSTSAAALLLNPGQQKAWQRYTVSALTSLTCAGWYAPCGT